MEQLAFDFPVPTDVQSELARLQERLGEQDVFGLLAKRRSVKDGFIRLLQKKHPEATFLYLCPKAIREYAEETYPEMLVVPIEQFTKRDKFLRLHDYAGPDAVLLMENVARYSRLDSDKFRYLHRLRKKTPHRYWIDIVPFTDEVSKLYLPLSYLTRDILGYPNGYAFEHDYLEEDEQGCQRRAHDPEHLAEKMAPWCHIAYDEFLPCVRHVDTAVTDEEAEAYAERKEKLFEEWDSPRKIVTRLADFSNALGSRYDALADLLRRLSARGGGEPVLFTNLKSHNRKIRSALRKRDADVRCDYRTYTTHDNRPIRANSVIFFETPINQNQTGALDVISSIDPESTLYHFRSDTNVDGFVFDEAWSEWQAIDSLTRALSNEQARCYGRECD